MPPCPGHKPRRPPRPPAGCRPRCFLEPQHNGGDVGARGSECPPAPLSRGHAARRAGGGPCRGGGRGGAVGEALACRRGRREPPQGSGDTGRSSAASAARARDLRARRVRVLGAARRPQGTRGHAQGWGGVSGSLLEFAVTGWVRLVGVQLGPCGLPCGSGSLGLMRRAGSSVAALQVVGVSCRLPERRLRNGPGASHPCCVPRGSSPPGAGLVPNGQGGPGRRCCSGVV